MKISETYNLSYLTQNPTYRAIVLRHLEPLNVNEQQLLQIHTTLENLKETNMGGGIPYEILQRLITELDSVNVSS